MKKHITMVSVLLTFILGLSSCYFSVEYETEPLEDAYIEVDDPNIESIDFTFTQPISSTLSPFRFRIIGKAVGEIPGSTMQRVNVERVRIHDANCNVMQEIVMEAWPRNASEQNRYGLELDDYNSDGYLDITIRRYPGEGSNNRTNYYWLWDNKAKQFVYDWRLSEAVTEENFIDFSLTQSIHEEIPPFTFRLIGRWIEGWSSELQDTVDDIDANIHVLQVIDSDGKVMQTFDRLNAAPPNYAPSFGLQLEDYNFDGFLDIALYLCQGGSMRNEPHLYWLWDNHLNRFVENKELSELSMYSSVSINNEENRLECYTRFGAFGGAIQYYKYIDESYVFVYSKEWEHRAVPNRDGKYMSSEITKELIDGEIVTSEVIEYYHD